MPTKMSKSGFSRIKEPHPEWRRKLGWHTGVGFAHFLWDLSMNEKC